jgi:uncharacterized protein YbjT (DUF2867 family)
MKFLVLGATGATGALFVEAAIAAGHEVTALARNPDKLAERHGLRRIGGDARDADALTRAADGVDALVSTLGVGRTRTPNDLILDTTRAVLAMAGQTGLQRVVFQSAFGVGASYPKASVPIRLGYHLAPAVFLDKAAGEKLLIASELDWTIVYPGILTNGPRSGNVTATDLAELDRLHGLPRISRADVAEFLLEAASGNKWKRRVAVIVAHK